MAALGASDWTVTVLSDRIHQKVRHVRATISLPTSGTYPSNGVPIPLYSKFGFKRNIEDMQIDTDNTGATLLGTRFKYDFTLQTIRVFVATTGNELATTANGDGSGAASVIYVTARGW